MPRKKLPKVWPAELDQKPRKAPEWDLDPPPNMKATREEIAAYGNAALDKYAKRDSFTNDEIERLLGLWLQFLGAKDSREALLRLAVLLDIPAFSGLVEVEQPEAWVPKFWKDESERTEDGEIVKVRSIVRAMKEIAAVDDLIRCNPGWSDVRALKELYPDLKRQTDQARKNLKTKKEALSRTRARRRSWRRAAP
jgi:hypothetical protein